jgi:hypothetical protein
MMNTYAFQLARLRSPSNTDQPAQNGVHTEAPAAETTPTEEKKKEEVIDLYSLTSNPPRSDPECR